MKETQLMLLFAGLISYSGISQSCGFAHILNEIPTVAGDWQGNTTYNVEFEFQLEGMAEGFGDSDYSITCLGDAEACNTLAINVTSNTTDHGNGLLKFNITQTSNVPDMVSATAQIRVVVTDAVCTGSGGQGQYTSNNLTLPVTLIGFNAEGQNEKILLTWNTASERDNEAFFIERSTDGLSFEAIGRVEGAGNSYTMQSYSFEDKELPKSARMVYYRLKQVDFDGSFEYSSIKNVILDADQHVNIEKIRTRKAGFSGTIMADRECEAELFITNLSGQVLKAQSVWMEKGVNNVDLDISSPDGIYFFTLKTQWGVTTRKFLKG